jgi:hypothetical protein
MGAAIAIGGPGPGGSPCACSRDRCRQWHALRRCAAGLRSATGASVRVFHGGPASTGGLVTPLWSEDRGHAIDRSVLDPPLRDSRSTWHPSVFGQCTAHEEPARTEERCAGKPMVAEIAHLRVAEQLVPTAFGDSRASYELSVFILSSAAAILADNPFQQQTPLAQWAVAPIVFCSGSITSLESTGPPLGLFIGTKLVQLL